MSEENKRIDAVVYKIDTAECVVAEDVSNYLDYIF